MLRLPPFTYHRPATLEDAIAALADYGPDARLVAGGTDLWPNMKRRHQTAATVSSLMRIPELRAIRSNGSRAGVRLGATTTLTEVADAAALSQRYPALVRAVESISSPPLRNMGTIGGNLCLDTRCTYYNQTEGWRRSIDYCMKEQGTICWVAPSSPRCWAHTASDSAPILCALDATLRLRSTAGERSVPITDFYSDDGIEYLTKRPEEMLVEIELPAASDSEHCRSSFWKLRRRGSIDFAVLSVAAAVWFDAGGGVARARIYLGAVGSKPVAIESLDRILVGRPLTADGIKEVAEAARKASTPMDNTDFKAQWRGQMAARYTEAALREIVGLDPGILSPHRSVSPT